MALFPLQPGITAIGEQDAVDSEIASIKGGEVMTLTTVRALQSVDNAAADDFDGYLYNALTPASNKNRVATTRLGTTALPCYLADDGIANYGTYYGQVMGTPAGLSTTSGSQLGPHTALGSGKVTLWDKPGRYAVTTDSLAADFISTLTAAGLTPGCGLGVGASTDIGKISHNLCTNKVATSGVAYFVDFKPRPGLVNTPNRLVGATVVYDRIEFDFHAGNGLRTVSS